MDVKLLEELKKTSIIPPVRPDDFGITISEFSDANRIGRKKGKELLDDLVETGVLECQTFRYVSGGCGNVYYKKGSWKE